MPTSVDPGSCHGREGSDHSRPPIRSSAGSNTGVAALAESCVVMQADAVTWAKDTGDRNAWAIRPARLASIGSP